MSTGACGAVVAIDGLSRRFGRTVALDGVNLEIPRGVVFGLVGAQMGWVLRPFVGNPSLPFTWFRGRESNFFQAVLHTISSLFS